MTEREAEIFNDSFERCKSNPEFLDYFYKIFMDSDDEIKQKFEHTDFKKQKASVVHSIYVLMSLVGNTANNSELEDMDRVAKLHDRAHLDVGPHLYDRFLESILAAVKKYDRRYDGEIENAWQKMMLHGIEFMKSRY